MMMNNNLTFFIITVLLTIQYTHSQNINSLSSSPYSLYGLGLTNELSTGTTNALGNAGIAMPSNTSINNLNPASYAAIPLNTFFFDIGIKAQRETLTEQGSEEPRLNANFSNLALAFPINKKSGLGLTLIPYTNVGYVILDVISNIEGSNDTYSTNIFGSGGLNDFKLNYGYSITEKLRLGLKASILFGEITETETSIIENTSLTLDESNAYFGFRFGAGFQYEITKNFTFGGIVNLPSNLNGSQETTVIQSDGSFLETTDDLDDFKLPLEIGVGIHLNIRDKFAVNFDYKRNFWDATNQSDRIGDYVDQDVIGLGLEYTAKKDGLKYWQRVQYRTGMSYDTGNLSINDNRIRNYAFNFGIGLPFRRGSNSMLNLTYSYGQKGLVTNGLIQENYHLLSLNLSLEGIWFIKPKFK